MKRMKTVLVLLVICGVAACQSYIDFRKPMRLLYGGDTLIISLQGDSVIFSGEAAELVLRDSTLLEIIQAHGGTGGGGTGTVKSAATSQGFPIFATHDSLTSAIALTGWNLYNQYGVGIRTVTDDVYLSSTTSGSIILEDKVKVQDSIYLQYLGSVGSSGDTWLTLTNTNALDTAHTEPAYIGWEMKDLPTLEEYEKDVKMINGHMERRIWYIDHETKELKSQYGWDGLGMMNTQSAYMIYHEITVRWMFEQNRQARNQQRQIAGLVLLLIILLIVHAAINRK